MKHISLSMSMVLVNNSSPRLFLTSLSVGLKILLWIIILITVHISSTHYRQHRRRLTNLSEVSSTSCYQVINPSHVLLILTTVPNNFSFSTQTKKYNDPQTILVKNYDDNSNVNTQTPPDHGPLHPLSFQICNRFVPISADVVVANMQQYSTSCDLLNRPPQEISIVLLSGFERYGRTGNNLIEFSHALQYARDHNMVLGIQQQSWATHLITDMWMAIHDDYDMDAWTKHIEQSLCVKIFAEESPLNQYTKVVLMDTRDDVKFLFNYQHDGSIDDYIEYQSHIIRTLWKSYNNGIGLHVRREPVRDMCSAMDAIFGSETGSVAYSVLHSRTLEGMGTRFMQRVSKQTGCDPTAALEMEPDYVKGILEPLGMLNQPIVFMTDHQRPDILERLQADPDISPNIHVISSGASWIGGDITLATTASAFIGNPASSLSVFIAKSRFALGYSNSFMFVKQADNGTWVETCDHHCLYW